MDKIERTKKMVLCAFFSALIAAGAFIKIPMPTMYFTLQAPVSILAGLILGSKYGAISVLLYIGMGLIGLPVFTEGGGIFYILKPSFGFILGFAAGAYTAGKIAHAVQNPGYTHLIAATFSGLSVLYCIGIVYFWCIRNLYLGDTVSLPSFLLFFILPVLLGDIALCMAVVCPAKKLIPLLGTK